MFLPVFKSSGVPPLPADINYASSNGTASDRSDYTAAYGTFHLDAITAQAPIQVLITNDVFVEGSETFTVTLDPVSGFDLINPTVTVTIVDNDTTPPVSNPLEGARFFVQQHYYDFLGRYPDSGGWDFWTSAITQCGSDQSCLNGKRIDVSNAFFYELEYQQTAAFVFRLYRAAFGNNQPFPNPDTSNQAEAKKIPSYQVFSQDRARLIGSANLAQDQSTLASLFVSRPEFLSRYPTSLTLDQFVDAVLAAIKNDDGVDLTSQRAALIGLGSRGAVLYRLANDDLAGGNGGINNRAFIDAEYNRAFVSSQYFGYLRRDGDIGGLLFWLGQVNSAALRDVNKQHAMVCSFVTSAEYQLRFSSVVTHSNGECPQ